MPTADRIRNPIALSFFRVRFFSLCEQRKKGNIHPTNASGQSPETSFPLIPWWHEFSACVAPVCIPPQEHGNEINITLQTLQGPAPETSFPQTNTDSQEKGPRTTSGRSPHTPLTDPNNYTALSEALKASTARFATSLCATIGAMRGAWALSHASSWSLAAGTASYSGSHRFT